MCKDRGRDGLTRLLSLELRACSLHAHATRPFPLTATSASPGFSPPDQGPRKWDAGASGILSCRLG